MLAKRVSELPEGEALIYEPKWDGFRTLVFRDGPEILLQSRDERPLNRYFPELLAALEDALPKRVVLDGEIVISGGDALDFDALQLRLHPAASRVERLSRETPASIVFFDLLAEGIRDLRHERFELRRRKLEQVLRAAEPPVFLTPATRDLGLARDWFRRFEGAGLDGVIAKPAGGSYASNERVMFKVKHERDCDCVVAGFRWHKQGPGSVGSLLLGLYDEKGVLHFVGVCASFTNEKRRELARFLEPFRDDALARHPWKDWAAREGEADPGQRMPGGQSRWSQGKDLSWVPLRPELVVEVAYDHMQSGRFRHTAQFRRFRSEKKPRDCTFSQLEVVPPAELAQIFANNR
jgi:ATP-dependent DNA ligase